MLLTRRHFLYGLAGIAALAALGGGGVAYSKMAANNSSGVSTLSVPENAVFTSDDCTMLESYEGAASLVSSQKLPYGSLVWANDDSVAACLLPGETGKPLAQIGLLSLGSGTYATVVENAVGESEGFEIYDVRACAEGLVWVEADILDGTWRVYHATADGASIGDPVMAEEGTSDWEMPALAAVGSYAFWQVLPRTDGAARTENSLFKRARFGEAETEEVYASKGRMACAPSAAADGVVIVPRASTSGTYYQLTRIDAASGEVTDAMVLPSSMKPMEVGYGKGGFSFAFDGIYNYGGGIANLGTYTPANEVEQKLSDGAALAAAQASSSSEAASASSGASGAATANETLAERNAATAASLANFNVTAYGADEWFRFPRTPVAAPAWCNDWFIVKSTSAVCGVNLESREYFALDVETGADSYGDYLASTGTGSRFVTYSNIDHTPISGERETHCLVRVWETA